MVNKAVITPLIAMSLLITALSPAHAQLASSSWPRYQGNSGNSGRTSIVAMGQRRSWSESSSGGTGGSSCSVGTDGTVYKVTSTGLMAVSPSGSKRWTHLGGGGSCTPAVGQDGTIYYGTHRQSGTENGTFYAVNSNGSTRWSFSFAGDDYESSPVIDALGNVYFGSNSGMFYSIRADTGSLNWQQQLGGIYGSPALDSMGRVLIGNSNGYLYAFDTTGHIAWHSWVGQSSFSSPAVAADGNIYMGSLNANSRLTAISPSGSLRWSRTTTGMNGSPAIGADGTVYIITADAALRAYSPSGTALWSYLSPTYNYSAAYFGSPVVDGNGTIYYTACQQNWLGALIAIDPNGTLKYQTAITSGLLPAAPAIGPQGQIYLGSGGEVICLVPEPNGILILAMGGLALAGGYNRRRRV